ncbi:MAG: alpha-hydroxy acid oxidase, partial [Ktedonobacterales bacterium]
PATWAYFSGGAGDEVTLRANSTAFERIQIVPRILHGTRTADLTTSVLDVQMSMPILVAPTASQGQACAEGECATASAAGDAGTVMVASTESTRSLEDIAAAATGPLWFQLYVYRDRAFAASLVRRAEAAGYRALVLTVDVQRWSGIERLKHIPLEQRPATVCGNFPPDMQLEGDVLTWEDLAWLRSLTSLPLVLKGVLSPLDAREAVARGVDALIVSNHGGRSLDGVLASIEALPAIAEVVAGRCEVYMDGGIRRGTDVLKALALGARAVLVGRPILWGLSVDGAEGARRVLETLRHELEVAMVLAGRPTLASIDAAVSYSIPLVTART